MKHYLALKYGWDSKKVDWFPETYHKDVHNKEAELKRQGWEYTLGYDIMLDMENDIKKVPYDGLYESDFSNCLKKLKFLYSVLGYGVMCRNIEIHKLAEFIEYINKTGIDYHLTTAEMSHGMDIKSETIDFVIENIMCRYTTFFSFVFMNGYLFLVGENTKDEEKEKITREIESLKEKGYIIIDS